MDTKNININHLVDGEIETYYYKPLTHNTVTEVFNKVREAESISENINITSPAFRKAIIDEVKNIK